MDFFLPTDCRIDSLTPYWLLATGAVLAIVGLALLAQAVMLWRRAVAAAIPWWRRLPLVLWAAISGVLAAQAWGEYRDVTTPLSCASMLPCSYKGICMPVVMLVGEARFVVLVAAVALAVGWLALSRISARARRV